MTDRLRGFVVTLDRDLREDDAEATLNAIRQVRGVIDVSPVVADYNSLMAYARVRGEVADRLIAFVRELNDPKSIIPSAV